MLKVENLVKIYNRRKVLKGINLQMHKGEIVGLLGPNGAGKTTTFYSIVGLIKPEKGSIYLNNDDITPLPMYKRMRKGIGYLSQEPALFKDLTVEENLLIALEIIGFKGDEKMKVLDEHLAKFGLTNLKNQPVYKLSGGEKRKVEISRTFLRNPQFLLLDEPFSGIDPVTVQELQNLIFYLKSQGIGVIITDHNIYETLPMLDRAYIIYDGEIFAEGDAKSIIENSEVRKIYLGEKIKMFGG